MPTPDSPILRYSGSPGGNVKRVWTVVSATVILLAMAAVVFTAPTDFVTRAPGTAVDVTSQQQSQPVVMVSGADTIATSGRILATAMVQSGANDRVTLPDLIAGYLLSNYDVLPRGNVYSSGQTPAEMAATLAQQVQSSREQAMAAAVRQSHETVVERPKVVAVRQSGPSYQRLFPGDLILQIDNTAVQTDADIRSYIRTNKQVGDQVVVTVMRGMSTSKVTIDKLVGTSTDVTIPTLGVSQWGTGYSYTSSIQITTAVEQGSPTQGLPLALATYGLLNSQDLTGGKIVAATGQISADGITQAVPGIDEHAMSAWSSQAAVFLIPRANCTDLTASFADMSIVPVGSLQEALRTLDSFRQGSTLPHC